MARNLTERERNFLRRKVNALLRDAASNQGNPAQELAALIDMDDVALKAVLEGFRVEQTTVAQASIQESRDTLTKQEADLARLTDGGE